MIRREDVVKIGKFGKPHGVNGEISITINTATNTSTSTSTVASTNTTTVIAGLPRNPLPNDHPFLICELDDIFVPFRIIESRFISDTTAYVQLKTINSDEAARILVNKDVYFDKHAVDIQHDAVSWDYFIGFKLIDKHSGEIGKITGIDDSTPNTLFIVGSRHATTLLIPANTDFITSIDEKHKQICLELPEGLLEISEFLSNFA
jgi:16S rRNA processing protein RimM